MNSVLAKLTGKPASMMILCVHFLFVHLTTNIESSPIPKSRFSQV
jgi:hypothetical protein